MNKQTKIIIYAVIAVLFYFLAIIPYLHNREATRVVKSVLKAWTENDFVKAFDGWETQQLSPPIYGLASYKILKKTFDRQHGTRHAEIFVYLEFNKDVDLPSEKIWSFELRKTRLGWKITDFHLSEDQSLD